MAKRAIKPTELKIIEGNWGRRDLNKGKPKPHPIAAKYPRDIDKSARKTWRHMAPILERLGLLTEKEGKYALNWTRLSCKQFGWNRVRLGLFVLAYNLGNFFRRLVLSREIRHWSLRTLLTKLIKIGAKVVRHSRYVAFQMACGGPAVKDDIMPIIAGIKSHAAASMNI